MKTLKIATLALTLASAFTFSGTAQAVPHDASVGQWPGTTGMTFATPVSWSNSNGYTVGAHFMRMQAGSMNPAGMLMQHHFANHDSTGGSTLLSSTVGGAAAGAAQVTIDLTNFGSTGLVDQFSNPINPNKTTVRIEVLTVAGSGFASVNSISGDFGGATVGDTLFDTATNTASTPWDGVNSSGANFDHTYIDYVFDYALDSNNIVIDSNGANIMQVFVWTEITAVPIPAAVWLFGSAIAGLFTTRRRNMSTAVAV